MVGGGGRTLAGAYTVGGGETTGGGKGGTMWLVEGRTLAGAYTGGGGAQEREKKHRNIGDRVEEP